MFEKEAEECAERAERIIRSKIDRRYIKKTGVITLDKESEND